LKNCFCANKVNGAQAVLDPTDILCMDRKKNVLTGSIFGHLIKSVLNSGVNMVQNACDHHCSVNFWRQYPDIFEMQV